MPILSVQEEIRDQRFSVLWPLYGTVISSYLNFHFEKVKPKNVTIDDCIGCTFNCVVAKQSDVTYMIDCTFCCFRVIYHHTVHNSE